MRLSALAGRFLLTCGLSAALRQGVFEVTKVEGRAELTRASGASEHLVRGASFGPGSQIRTMPDSKVELVLSNGAGLEVAADSFVILKEFRQVASPFITSGNYAELASEPSVSVVAIEVTRGKVKAGVSKLKPESSFTVKTPVGVVRHKDRELTPEPLPGSMPKPSAEKPSTDKVTPLPAAPSGR